MARRGQLDLHQRLRARRGCFDRSRQGGLAAGRPRPESEHLSPQALQHKERRDSDNGKRRDLLPVNEMTIHLHLPLPCTGTRR